MHAKALSLLEIIISVVILSLVITGLVNVFIVGKRYVQHSRSRVTAVELGRDFLDPLWQYVRLDTWGSNPLGTRSLTSATTTISTPSPITYTVAGVVNTISGTDVLRVTTNISWDESLTY